MSNQPHIRKDLTRWNRAGLTRFDYIDGDAAIWLEELRLALIGQFMRGEDTEVRTADTWRDLNLDETDPTRRIGLDVEELAKSVIWKRIAPNPNQPLETRGQRSQRLLKQYQAEPSGDQTWEIMRAFARASHVLLGHLNAYANEGYLRTATQWDNLRRLAALVNYQPAPPASASTLVALLLKPDAGTHEIAAGLAMKHTPQDGEGPLVLETRTALLAHPDLNAARLLGWDINERLITVANATWIYPEKTKLSVGDITLFTNGFAGSAGVVNAVSVHGETARIDITGTTISLPAGKAELLIEAEAARRGLARVETDEFDIGVKGGTGVKVGDLVRVISGTRSQVVTVTKINGEALRVRSTFPLSGQVEVIPLATVAKNDNGGFSIGGTQKRSLYYRTASGVGKISKYAGADLLEEVKAGAVTTGFDYKPTNNIGDLAWFEPDSSPALPGRVTGKRPPDEADLRRVSFEGKPPKSLIAGGWLVARSETGDNLTALRVVRLRTMADAYEVEFHQAFAGAPETFEFHGPMKTPLRPLGHDRSPDPAMPGNNRVVILTGVSEEARSLLRPGRDLIFSEEFGNGSGDIAARIVEAERLATGHLRLTFDTAEDTSGLIRGETLVRMNVAQITHGESKGQKTLGSGDGERGEQVFTLQVRDISHVPSSLSINGVIPDMVVTVDGEAWDYRDYTDASAEGARAWSTTLGEDGYLRIHFRRRLPTGLNNVAVLRHRTGTGARGNNIPPLSIKKPMRKHPAVEAIHQPFATSGGANREPVASLRESAPSRLSANGRAVSLRDFERLAAGHASVLRARAEEIPTASIMRDVRLTLVPAGGGALPPELIGNIRNLVQAQAIPGVRLSFAAFGPVRLSIGAELRADLLSHDKTDVLAAAQDALLAALSLEARELGKPVFVAEIHAALASVAGIETTRITAFDHLPTPTPPARVARRDGAVAAIYPTPDQVIFLGDLADLTLDIRGIDDA